MIDGDGLAQRLEGARALCERRMTELAGREGGQLPREWFRYHDIVKKLRPLVHAAEEVERVHLGAETRVER